MKKFFVTILITTLASVAAFCQYAMPTQQFKNSYNEVNANTALIDEIIGSFKMK